MHLELNNIGKLSDASIDINGIAVIAGENNTGKSTVGKVLFSVFNSYYDSERQINKERMESIMDAIQIIMDIRTRTKIFFPSKRLLNDFAKKLLNDAARYANSEKLIKEEVYKLLSDNDIEFDENNDDKKNMINYSIIQIQKALNVSKNDLFCHILEKRLNSEFDGQISNIFTNSEGIIVLTIKSEDITININNNEVTTVRNDISLKTETVYLDDPFIIDDINYMGYYRPDYDLYEHRNHLKYKLRHKQNNSNIKEILVNDKLDSIIGKIETVCTGNMITTSSREYGYIEPGSNGILHIKNISAGLKSFVILKTLLQNGVISYNGTMILDEPEVHLHPEWQLLLAEIIVLLQKEFSLHILLTTHSPYFLEAIEVYSKKYCIEDKCTYYLAENNGYVSHLKDASENLEEIYSKLAHPLQRLEYERCEDDD
jgi:AAA15 family ATPase/GTPase